MHRYFLLLALGIPLCGTVRRYVDSPFYKPASAIHRSARVEGSNTAASRRTRCD